MSGRKTKKKSERVSAGSVCGRRTKPGETGRGRNEGNRPELILEERGECLPHRGTTNSDGTICQSLSIAVKPSEQFHDHKLIVSNFINPN